MQNWPSSGEAPLPCFAIGLHAHQIQSCTLTYPMSELTCKAARRWRYRYELAAGQG
jgi:hypothetical protein